MKRINLGGIVGSQFRTGEHKYTSLILSMRFNMFMLYRKFSAHFLNIKNYEN